MDIDCSPQIRTLPTQTRANAAFVAGAHDATSSEPIDDADSDSLEDLTDEDDEDDVSALSDISSEEESRNDNHAPTSGYVRCPPSIESRRLDQSLAPTWTVVGENSVPTSPGTIRSVRSSDNLSVTSSRKSLPINHHSGTHKILGPVAVNKGQLVSVRRRTPSKPPLPKKRSKSESNILTPKREKSKQKAMTSPPPSIRRKSTKDKDESSMRPPSTRSISALFGRSSPGKPSNSKSSSSKRPIKTVTCVSCLEDDIPHTEAAHTKCNHHMCRSCVHRLFVLSTTDVSLMPPRCCDSNEIEPLYVQRLFGKTFLDKAQMKAWNSKYEESKTKNRLYCTNKECGAWIPPDQIEKSASTGRKRGTCKKCKTQVCKKCSRKWHYSRECEVDEDTKKVLALAEETAGWQRCYRCKAVVSLDTGCNHMTCRCGAQFCMLCGRKWRDPLCQVECPLFSVPDDPNGLAAFIVEDFGPWRPQGRRGEDPLANDLEELIQGQANLLGMWNRGFAGPPPPPPPPPEFPPRPVVAGEPDMRRRRRAPVGDAEFERAFGGMRLGPPLPLAQPQRLPNAPRRYDNGHNQQQQYR
ncbi:hypothetical protein BT63DRAFT_428614 [Microthyrium microscopicum]|uniref:RBR-type E3 ubiquitin transferase n=1 Tax=Microthyrium microscopicum TaxID=703497 RepID=A0A6A6U0N0_9PEZI|nr:hypothetical protein BT63DRAFT_428614 [Microthyrium microscopicum]